MFYPNIIVIIKKNEKISTKLIKSIVLKKKNWHSCHEVYANWNWRWNRQKKIGKRRQISKKSAKRIYHTQKLINFVKTVTSISLSLLLTLVSMNTHLTSFRFNQAVNFIIPNNNICIIQFIYKNLFAISLEKYMTQQ